jgi:hypothetical protein
MSSEDDRSSRRGRGQRLADQDNQNLALFVYQKMEAGEQWGEVLAWFCDCVCVRVEVGFKPSFVREFIKKTRARIFNLLRSPRMDAKESIPPAYVAWRAGTSTLFLLGS